MNPPLQDSPDRASSRPTGSDVRTTGLELTDNLKLSKRKREWREKQYAKCVYSELEDGQTFPADARKVVLWYPSNKKADGGFVDAEWSQRIEIHHIGKDGVCHTYYDERPHDGIDFSKDWQRGSAAPTPSMVKVQRDGATQMLIWDAFSVHNYQALELRGMWTPEAKEVRNGTN